MDPGTKGYGNEYGGAPKIMYQGGGAIPAFADDEVNVYDDEYGDLYNDVNFGKGFQHMQQPILQMQSAGGFHAPQTNPVSNIKGHTGATESSQTGRVMGTNFNSQNQNLGFQKSNPMPQKVSGNTLEFPVNGSSGAAPVLNPGIGHNQTSVNVNQHTRPVIDNGSTMLFVGELHWWTTDAELENALSQYGRVKEIKFFEERVSGKSKGYCQVEFYDSATAAMCKERMYGHVFNGRACVVNYSSPQTMRQMGSSYVNRNQAQTQLQPQGRRPINDGISRGSGSNQQPNNKGDGGRNYGGRGCWERGGSGMVNRGPGGGPVRGRCEPIGGKSLPGGGAFRPGMGVPAIGGPVGGMMGPPGMMGAGFDPTFMGGGVRYGGFLGPAYPGMMPSFPQVNPAGLTGVTPHVNPAFFGRGLTSCGMGMGIMAPPGMDGQQGMWNDTSMGGGGGGEEYEEGGSEYGHGDGNQEKGVRSSVASREKGWGSERAWSGNSEKRRRDERDVEKERSERTHRYREENEDWDRGQSSSRSRSRSRAMLEENYRRSRDVDFGKRRRK